MYWVSFIRKREDGKLELCAESTAYPTIDFAEMEIIFKRKHYDIASAWIDTFLENGEKITAFHECYLDYFGNVIK